MKATLSKIAILGLMIVVAASFFSFDLQHYFTLDNLKTHQHAFARYYESHTVLTIALYFVLYLVMAVVLQPVFLVLTFCTLYGSISLKDPIFSGHLNKHIDSKNRATVLSLISMLSGLYVALMGLLIGRIGDFSLPYAFAFMGVIVLAGSLAFRVD